MIYLLTDIQLKAAIQYNQIVNFKEKQFYIFTEKTDDALKDLLSCCTQEGSLVNLIRPKQTIREWNAIGHETIHEQLFYNDTMFHLTYYPYKDTTRLHKTLPENIFQVSVLDEQTLVNVKDVLIHAYSFPSYFGYHLYQAYFCYNVEHALQAFDNPLTLDMLYKHHQQQLSLVK